MTERISVRNHYRTVTRDSKGRFVSVRKWQASKEQEITISKGLMEYCINALQVLKDKGLLDEFRSKNKHLLENTKSSLSGKQKETAA